MNIGLVICPWYSGGTSPPLGLGYINSVLINIGAETIPYDLEFLFAKDDPVLINYINAIFGFPAHKSNRVMNIIRPELLLYSLFPDAYDQGLIPATEYEVKLINIIRAKLEMYIDDLLKNNLDLVLFSTYVTNLAISLLAAQIVKSKTVIPIIFGGPGVSIPEVYQFVLKMGFVDCCVVGEGERTISDIVSNLNNDSVDDSIPGVATESNMTNVVSRSHISSLESIPFPSFENFPLRGYELRAYLLSGKGTFIPISTCRGCIMKCSFCSECMFWKSFRQRSVDSVIDEIEYHTNKYKIYNIRFNDSLTNADSYWLSHLCDILIDKELKVNWVYTYLIPVDIDNILADKLKKAGINTFVNVLNGFPNETLDEYFDNLQFYHQYKMNENSNNTCIYWLPSGLLRIEAYSDIYINPPKYNINILPCKIYIPKSLHYLEKYISKLACNWEDSVPYDEKILRNRVLTQYLLNTQPNILKWEQHTNIDHRMIRESSVFRSVNKKQYEILKYKRDQYFIIYKYNIINVIDNLSYNLYMTILNKPKSIKQIQKEINKKMKKKIKYDTIIMTILKLLNMKPHQLIKIDMSDDMISK